MRCELEFGVFCVCGTFAVRQVPPTQMGSSRRGRLRRWHTHTHTNRHTNTVAECYFDTVSNVAAILLLAATFFVLCRIFDLVFDCSNSVLFSVVVVVVIVGFGFFFFFLFCIFSSSLLLAFCLTDFELVFDTLTAHAALCLVNYGPA